MLSQVFCRDEIFQGKLGLRGIKVEECLAAARLLWGHLYTCTSKNLSVAKWVPWKTLSALPAPWAGLGLLPPEKMLVALL